MADGIEGEGVLVMGRERGETRERSGARGRGKGRILLFLPITRCNFSRNLRIFNISLPNMIFNDFEDRSPLRDNHTEIYLYFIQIPPF